MDNNRPAGKHQCVEEIQYSVIPYGSCNCCKWAQMKYGMQSNCFLNDIRQDRNAQHADMEEK